ncbi:globin domain-containing protein [Kitasatospora sp. NPDC049258]|uniref:globin domain-containing protein n=1 Tax=Kitasatospora sp. NPDC049258 TaxID=3155394 RepID=UPI00342BDE1C
MPGLTRTPPDPAHSPDSAHAPDPAPTPEPEQAAEPEPEPVPAAGPAAAAEPADPPVVAPPPMPTEPPRIPAPAAPVPWTPAPAGPVPADPARPEPSAPGPAPAPHYEPLFTDAPGLNWSGPGDHWSRAWALDTLAAEPARQGRPALPAAEPPGAGRPADEPPTPRDIELIRASLAVVEPLADRATAHFYALIFLHHPEVRALFPAAMDVQRDRLFRALLLAARSADDPAGLTEYLSRLGEGHRKYGTLTGHYGPVGECLVAALATYCGSRWDADTELAWRRVYGLVSKIMINAAEASARTAPPWWQAEVVSHQQRTPDIAVLTLRPDQAYPYRAGQYATVETPWWPRVWRHFSFATAPRPDGLLTFHVKAVQAGWVSNALVHRAAPGDVLRLGPAAGRMVLDGAGGDDGGDGGLLLLGGGTGIAPICALVEELEEHGPAGRRVQVFYGARRAAELHELASLRRAADRHPWLTVHPVLSAERPTGGALGGDLPEVVAGYGPWHGHSAYLSGPAAMVRRGTAALLRTGVPAGRIRHDLVGDLAAG